FIASSFSKPGVATFMSRPLSAADRVELVVNEPAIHVPIEKQITTRELFFSESKIFLSSRSCIHAPSSSCSLPLGQKNGCPVDPELTEIIRELNKSPSHESSLSENSSR